MRLLSKFLIALLIISSIPEFAVMAYSETKEEKSATTQPEDEDITLENLDELEGVEELEKERTPSTKTYTDGEGQYYKELYAEPIHSKENKKMEEIDETLNVEDKNNISTTNTDLEVTFPRSIKKDQSIIFEKDDHQLVFDVKNAVENGQLIEPNKLSKTELEHNKVQYENI